MNFLNKWERKLGRYAIPNLMIGMIAAYCIGFALYYLNPSFFAYLTLSPYHILHGQIWRLITWILVPNSTNIFSLLIMSFFYYQIGTTLEHTWGTFRFNVYIFGGMFFTVLGAFLLYLIQFLLYGGAAAAIYSLQYSVGFSTSYINLSIFLAFAVMYPEMQILLMFIIPVKMKWMAYIYAALVIFECIVADWGGRFAIVMSLLNFVIFFFSTRNYKKISPQEIHRRQKFKSAMQTPKSRNGITKHKCAVCGRTEQDDPNLTFRFCSKCEGNYEYCQEHLFTHKHIKR
ncbi:MAG: hypothetical protein IJ567_02325 [Lachnospiraceae bacterium]|nr:hypothetical protein [Lachnospiraceae bacterium]